MKRFLLLLLFCGMCAAQTTPNLNFNIPLPGTQTNVWGPLINFNFTQLDNYLSGSLALPSNLLVTGTLTSGSVSAATGTIGSLTSTTFSATSATLGSLSATSLSSGTGAFTTSLSMTNPGIYTNAGTNQYLTSFLGGFSSTIPPYSVALNTDAIAGGVTIPSGATQHNVTGVSGAVLSNCVSSSRIRCNGVALFGFAQGNVNDAAVWGLNPIIEDIPGISANLTGGEFDIGVAGTPTYVHGVDITMSGTYQGNGTAPTGSNNNVALQVGATFASGLQWQYGFLGARGGFSTAAIWLDGAGIGGAFPTSSGEILLTGYDGGNVGHSGSINVDLHGNLMLNAAAGQGVQVSSATLATLNSATVNNGTVAYCSDCKNVPDNAAVAGAACVNSGSGAIARRQNARWDCN